MFALNTKSATPADTASTVNLSSVLLTPGRMTRGALPGNGNTGKRKHPPISAGLVCSVAEPERSDMNRCIMRCHRRSTDAPFRNRLIVSPSDSPFHRSFFWPSLHCFRQSRYWILQSQ